MRRTPSGIGTGSSSWIDTQRMEYGLDEMCRVVDVKESGYRAWKRGGKPERKRLTDGQMLALIQSVNAELKGAYGSPRMVRDCGNGFRSARNGLSG